MTSAMENMAQEALNELKRSQERLTSIRQKLQDISVKVRSKDRMLTVTCAADGTVKSIEFNTQKFRKIAPAELGSILVETIRHAQEQTRDRVLRAYQPAMAGGPGLGMRDGKIDLDKMFEDAMRQADELTAEDRPGNTGLSPRKG